MNPVRPADEALRLQTLRQYDSLDTLPERALDDLTALAAHVCEAPIALITLVDEQRQWFKSKIGLSACETPRNISFCGHAILQPEVFVVPDAAKDERFADNPMVTGEPGIRFYGAMPLMTPEGHAIGTLCVIDRVPRQLNPWQLEALRVLSRQVMAQLELRRQTRNLIENERVLSTLISNLPGVAYRCLNDADWTMTFISEGCQAVTGYERDELENNRVISYASLIHPDDRDWLWKKCQASLEARTPCNNEYRIIAKTGETRWVWERAMGVYAADGTLLSIEGFVQDIAGRKQAEAALRVSHVALKSISQGVIITGPDQSILSTNVPFMAITGYVESDILGHNCKFLQGPLTDPQAVEAIRVALRSHTVFDGEILNYRKDGTPFWNALTISPVFDAQGALTQFIGVTRDITARRHAEQVRRESELQLRLVIRGGDLGFWDWNATTGQLAVNDRWLAMLGQDPQGPMPTIDLWHSLVHPDDMPKLNRLVDEVILNPAGRDLEVEIRARHSDGHYIWILDKASVVERAGDGSPLRVVGTHLDITARKEAEAELREIEERFRQLAENVQEVFWISDTAKYQVFYVSPAYETIWGRTCAHLYQHPRSWLEAIHPEDRARILHAAETKQALGLYNETYRIHRPDGSMRWIHDRAFPVHGPNGEVQRIVGTAEDITERRQLEDQLRQSQKMEAIGQLASGVAHDFNNILAAILGNVELAMEDTAPEHPARESLAEIKTASARATSLVQQILTFSRQQPGNRRVIALGPLIKEASSLLRATIPSIVEVITSVAADAPLVLADSTQMHQVLVNLCTNAWHALAGQPGRIEIKLECVTLDTAAAGRLAGLRPGRFARLCVTDTGTGINAATLARIFDPFFTTKEVGRGTGLGLSVVHGIVQGHDGAIAVVSEPGQGATFEVYFPAATTLEDFVSVLTSSSHRGEGQSILYIDDEGPLVNVATRMLERLGYRVTGFTSAAAAVKAFRENPGQFDLVITDLNMPGTSGLEVAGEIGKLRPELPVVLSSGRVTEDLRQRAHSAGICDVLHKPTAIDELSGVIHRLIGRTRRH